MTPVPRHRAAARRSRAKAWWTFAAGAGCAAPRAVLLRGVTQIHRRGGCCLWAWSLALGLTLPGPRALALDGGPLCADEAARIERLGGALATCTAEGEATARRLAACGDRAAAGDRALGACARHRDELGAAREALCGSLGALAEAILLETPLPQALDPCVPPEHRAGLERLLTGWSRTRSQLEALDAFAAGETNRPPRAAHERPNSRLEELTARLLGDGRGESPLLYRRLLVEALRRFAPAFWSRLSGRGRAAIDGWFASRAPLDEELAQSASGAATAAFPGEDGPPLVTALRLVESYLTLGSCKGDRGGDCRRARELRVLLESSGPLVVQQREQGIWATDCRALDAHAILGWLQDVPSPQAALAASDWSRLTGAAFAKLYSCFLGEPAGGPSFSRWAAHRLPGPELLTSRGLTRVQEIAARFVEGDAADACAQAVRSLQTLSPPAACELPAPVMKSVAAWLPLRRKLTSESQPSLRACAAMADLLWSGDSAAVPPAFDHPPTADEIVRRVTAAAPTPVGQLRSLCEARRGSPAGFPGALSRLGELAAGFGEALALAPWRVDAATHAPLEATRFARARRLRSWLRHLPGRESACAALGLAPSRCELCATEAVGSDFDCALLSELERRWDRWDRRLLLFAILLGVALALAAWLRALARARRESGPWIEEVRTAIEGMGLRPLDDPWRWLWPSRLHRLSARLPVTLSWERWGSRAAIVRAARGARWTERDIQLAAGAARALDAQVAILVHDEGGTPDLGAVRAMLEWAARPTGKTVQILPIPTDRLRWARSPEDLLDLVEQTSLRGNPFEVRGRITSSSQFFNRERLVSGLLAGAQAGHWLLVTGLRRFGKSSLALEVTRRLMGPSAYVDLAGFHHEFAFLGDPARAADSILRYVCVQLQASARTFTTRSDLPQLPPEGVPLDGSHLAEWLQAFARAHLAAGGPRPGTALIVLDEIEQALATDAAHLQGALEVLAIVIGRLRAALGDPALASGLRVGVLLCGAIHPVLWAPLSTLTGQSLAGAFPRVCVPRLPDDAALAMLRGLGARHGIRFTDPAIELIVRETQGIALLVRRLASSVLELYDPERARQGALGALEIGIEGVRAALRREQEPGSALRVWVESEIGDAQSPVGRALRELALRGRMETLELRQLVTDLTRAEFDRLGFVRLLPVEELARRAVEAGSTVVQILAEVGVLEAEGDLASPEAFLFPDGLLRRIFAASASPSARP